MIRLIFADADAGMAANFGGPVEVTHKTFDLDLPEVEAWLREPKEKKWQYSSRSFVGIELKP